MSLSRKKICFQFFFSHVVNCAVILNAVKLVCIEHGYKELCLFKNPHWNTMYFALYISNCPRCIMEYTELSDSWWPRWLSVSPTAMEPPVVWRTFSPNYAHTDEWCYFSFAESLFCHYGTILFWRRKFETEFDGFCLHRVTPITNYISIPVVFDISGFFCGALVLQNQWHDIVLWCQFGTKFGIFLYIELPLMTNYISIPMVFDISGFYCMGKNTNLSTVRKIRASFIESSTAF